MSLNNREKTRVAELHALAASGRAKGAETVITGVVRAANGRGPRYHLAGHGERPFLRFNSNAYLGLALDPAVVRAEAQAAERFGTGPGAVRFISGTYAPHVDLERRLAAFHGREAAIVMSAAYTTMLGVLPQLLSQATLVISDALNHNCIINAMRLARAGEKAIYPHLDFDALERTLAAGTGRFERACVVTDGIFSMRGDHAPLAALRGICDRHAAGYAEGVILVVDDSHGIGAFGATGRGTEEHCAARADVLIGTLGKALGVNGGYAVSSARVIEYLRETAPLYIYSNPITPAEAAAACASLGIVDTPAGRVLLERLRSLTTRLRTALPSAGFETLPGEHPIVPVMIRDTVRTAALTRHLFEHGILATGLKYPVVPEGEEAIRLQVSADHTEGDVDEVIGALRRF